MEGCMQCAALFTCNVVIDIWLAVQVALQRFDGSVYDGFYDRQVVVMVSSEGGDASDQPAEDKQVIPDDNIFQYEVEPGEDDKIIRVSVSKHKWQMHALIINEWLKVLVNELTYLESGNVREASTKIKTMMTRENRRHGRHLSNLDLYQKIAEEFIFSLTAYCFIVCLWII